MTREYFLENIAPTLPHAPGIYRYYNNRKKILYVGKAKDIRKRVASYFLKQQDNFKTKKLVTQIASIEYTITNSEHDAFLLENNLIKHFKPVFNIALKDDKSYPFVVIKNEPFPRVFLTRQHIKDGSEYIGPFTGVWRVRELLDLIKQNIPLRTCSLDLQPKNIEKGKFKVCLEYHLGNCKGPCEGKQSLEDYQESIVEVKNLLRGNLGPSIKLIKRQMEEAAASLHFERAQRLARRLEAFETYNKKSDVVSIHVGNVDAATIVDTENYAFVNYLTIRNGKMLHSKNLTVEKKLDEEPKDILSYSIAVIRPTLPEVAMELVLPFNVDLEDQNILQTIPISGEKKSLLELSFKNAHYKKEEVEKKRRLMLHDKTDDERQKVLEGMQKDLRLTELPEQIECFDNSNFQGSYPVAAMVCFRHGQPYKKEYRHFHIKTVEGINDFASMQEIVYRRYKRQIDEGKPLPQLVIIDGGKGQLSSAMESIRQLGIENKMTVVGLAKREEEIFYPGDTEALKLPFNGQTMLLIRRIRDEVHRFGITFHRNVRSKSTIKNELQDIKGIGDKTAQTLLQAHRSVAKIKKLSEAEIAQSIGAAKAHIVYAHFHPK